jgi:hypothetical protein
MEWTIIQVMSIALLLCNASVHLMKTSISTSVESLPFVGYSAPLVPGMYICWARVRGRHLNGGRGHTASHVDGISVMNWK